LILFFISQHLNSFNFCIQFDNHSFDYYYFILFYFIFFLIYFSFSIPSLIVLFHLFFILYLVLVFFIAIYFVFLIIFKIDFFFQFHHSILGWLRILNFFSISSLDTWMIENFASWFFCVCFIRNNLSLITYVTSFKD
jgi:hypothetical protein